MDQPARPVLQPLLKPYESRMTVVGAYWKTSNDQAKVYRYYVLHEPADRVLRDLISTGKFKTAYYGEIPFATRSLGRVQATGDSDSEIQIYSGRTFLDTGQKLEPASGEGWTTICAGTWDPTLPLHQFLLMFGHRRGFATEPPKPPMCFVADPKADIRSIVNQKSRELP